MHQSSMSKAALFELGVDEVRVGTSNIIDVQRIRARQRFREHWIFGLQGRGLAFPYTGISVYSEFVVTNPFVGHATHAAHRMPQEQTATFGIDGTGIPFDDCLQAGRRGDRFTQQALQGLCSGFTHEGILLNLRVIMPSPH